MSDRAFAARDDLPPICRDCTEDHGLCTRHVPDVCPRLKQASWQREVVSGDRDTRTHQRHTPKPSAAALRVMRRKARREERRRLRESAQRTRRLVLEIRGAPPAPPVRTFAAAWAS